MKKIFLLLAASVALCAGAQNADAIISKLKKEIAPDSRTAVWDVRTVMQKGILTLVGEVDNQMQVNAIEQALEQNGVYFKNHLVVLEDVPAKHYGVVKLAIASLRTAAKHSAEMATQAVMGMPVKILDGDDWLHVQTPDGYISWVPESSVEMMDAERFDQWRKSTRYIVTAMSTTLVESPKGDAVVSDLVLGNILEFKGFEQKGKWVHLATPDGREGYVEASTVQELKEWADQEVDMNKIEATAFKMMGAGYLWGGTSTKVTDCSGLTKVSYYSNGVILQRDASQQCLTGKYIDGKNWHEAKLGDLLFFGNEATGRITHVGIYLRDGKYIHCSGRVKVNSLDSNDPSFLYNAIRISRIDGEVGTKGIVAVKSHPWYF